MVNSVCRVATPGLARRFLQDFYDNHGGNLVDQTGLNLSQQIARGISRMCAELVRANSGHERIPWVEVDYGGSKAGWIVSVKR